MGDNADARTGEQMWKAMCDINAQLMLKEEGHCRGEKPSDKTQCLGRAQLVTGRGLKKEVIDPQTKEVIPPHTFKRKGRYSWGTDGGKPKRTKSCYRVSLAEGTGEARSYANVAPLFEWALKFSRLLLAIRRTGISDTPAAKAKAWAMFENAFEYRTHGSAGKGLRPILEPAPSGGWPLMCSNCVGSILASIEVDGIDGAVAWFFSDVLGPLKKSVWQVDGASFRSPLWSDSIVPKYATMQDGDSEENGDVEDDDNGDDDDDDDDVESDADDDGEATGGKAKSVAWPGYVTAFESKHVKPLLEAKYGNDLTDTYKFSIYKLKKFQTGYKIFVASSNLYQSGSMIRSGGKQAGDNLTYDTDVFCFAIPDDKKEALTAMLDIFRKNYDLNGASCYDASTSVWKLPVGTPESGSDSMWYNGASNMSATGLTDFFGNQAVLQDNFEPYIREKAKQIVSTATNFTDADFDDTWQVITKWSLMKTLITFPDITVESFRRCVSPEALHKVKKNGHYLLLGFIPLTSDGLWLRLLPELAQNDDNLQYNFEKLCSWLNGETYLASQSTKRKDAYAVDGVFVFIPYGSMLVIPAEMYYAGSLRTGCTGNEMAKVVIGVERKGACKLTTHSPRPGRCVTVAPRNSAIHSSEAESTGRSCDLATCLDCKTEEWKHDFLLDHGVNGHKFGAEEKPAENGGGKKRRKKVAETNKVVESKLAASFRRESLESFVELFVHPHLYRKGKKKSGTAKNNAGKSAKGRKHDKNAAGKK